MKPIAQTFIATEPQSGIETVVLTQVDLYFQSKSSIFGVEVQIRTTDGGFPTSYILPHASKILQSSEVTTSSDASEATSFVFDTPVILKTNQQFAIVVVPVAGNPDYNIWTAELGQIDATTGNPIFTNNQLGSLFTSSNDLNFTPIQNESMKYTLYVAEFSSSSGTAVFHNDDSDFFTVSNRIGDFITSERVVMANNILNLTSMTVTTSNTLTVGEILVQPSSANQQTATAYGTVLSGNSTVVVVKSTNGAFTTAAGALKGLTSGSIISQPTIVNANVVTSTTPGASNKITLPCVNTSIVPDIAYGNYIFIGSDTRANTYVAAITAIDNSTNTITISANLTFSTNTGFFGRVKADANLVGYFSSVTDTSDIDVLVIDKVTSNDSTSFANSGNLYLIGTTSGATAKIIELSDFVYDSITGQFASITPKLSTMTFDFEGTSNTKTVDTSPNNLIPDVPVEFVDKPRIIMSRSNEWTNYISPTAGTPSLTIDADIGSSNNSVSPFIDTVRTVATLTHNIIQSPANLSGYYISIANSTGGFANGSSVIQENEAGTANTIGTIISCNASFIVVSNLVSSNTSVSPSFNANGTSIIRVSTDLSKIANVSSSIKYDESKENGLTATRYISKNVILAEGQDAEDLICYLGAYRPAQTNFQVFGKFLAAADSDTFSSKVWSSLTELSSPALNSSLVNRNDIVELSYELPTSQNVFSSGASCNATSNVVVMPSTNTSALFVPGQFVYLADVGYYVSGATITAAGSGYANGDVVEMTGTSGYTNATFSVVTNGSGGVVGVNPVNPGSYISNTDITANTTTASTGVGTGLKLTISGSNYTQSNKFNVRSITSIPNTSAIVLSSNCSIASGNVALGTIPGILSQYSTFRYSRNNYIARYTTPTDGIFDSFKTFAVKIVMTSNSSQIVPRMTDMRCLALQV